MVLELKNINKSFGKKQVLNDVSFKVESGKAFGLLGRNGAGKTTTLRILMDVFKADSGEILVDGKVVDRNKIGFGYLPEERGLYAKRKIFDQLVYFATLKGMKRREAIESVDYWISRLDMVEFTKKRLETLSKGNQQKIQLITALAHNPDIIILDEPFSGLDPVNAMLLKDIVKETIKKGKIVLFSSHQMNYIEEFCDDIAIINGGNVVLKGDICTIKRNYPRNRLVIRSLQADKILCDYAGNCKFNEKNDIIMSLSNPNDKQSIMQEILGKYDVDEIKVYEPSLSDIFVEYTEKINEGD